MTTASKPSPETPTKSPSKLPGSGPSVPTPAVPVGVEAGSPSGGLAAPVTIRTLMRMRERGEKFACLTCYDATTARWLERAGIPVLLVGDTAAEMILGLPGTIHATMDFMVILTAAVKRGAPKVMVMADMPFMSYQVDDSEALRNAARFMTEGRADVVKLEVDRSHAALVEKMARAGIPVVAHIGSRPQLAKLRGGYSAAGRTVPEAHHLMADAAALEAAGAALLLVEAVPLEVAERIVQRATVPVIGCGAGPACDGQVVVLQDILGLTDWQPAFAQPLASIGEQLASAARLWSSRVREGELGDHPYRMVDGGLAGT
ncbi:MAG: 3-methyl-2-oxobutanoate hydroxymethyltransferase [Phycisphaerales bacterium]|nr:3-methyl-2-oxobutanoate hydroxymethyltransferase [Phycisphaerales bacterium]